MVKKRIPPVHPGAYLKELLDELGLSQYRLAKDIGVPAMRVNYIVNGKRVLHYTEVIAEKSRTKRLAIIEDLIRRGNR